MKKILILGMMILSCLLIYADENEGASEESGEGTVAEGTTSEGAAPSEIRAVGGTSIGKGDSFMASFGMGDSSLVAGGEAGGVTSSAGSTTVGTSGMNVGSSSLTSSQNTPYLYY